MTSPPRLSRTPRLSPDGESSVSGSTTQYLYDAVSSMDDGFFVLDREWRYIYVNSAGSAAMGKPLAEILGHCMWDIVPELLGTDFEREYRRAMADQVTVRFEAEYEPYGAWFKIHAYPTGENLAVIARDITRHKQTQEALLDSEARHRAIVQAVPDLMLWIGLDGFVRNADMRGSHPLCHACEDTDREGVVARHIHTLFSPEVATRVHEVVRQVIETASADEFDLPFSSPHGEVSVFEARVVPVDSKAAILVVRDVTERRRLELEVLRISEDVRRAIGRDLHDGLSSHLTGVAMLTRRLARDTRRDRPAAAEDIDQVADLIAEGNEQARRLAHGLNPVIIERDGLCAALAILAKIMQTDGASRCRLTFASLGGDGAAGSIQCPPGVPKLDIHIAIHLYRIAQEAVHNAVRHADPSEVQVSLDEYDGDLLLSVTDDGCGFDPQSASGMGINVMKYRARLIGGSLEIRTRPEGGTVVACLLPLLNEYVINPEDIGYALQDIRS